MKKIILLLALAMNFWAVSSQELMNVYKKTPSVESFEINSVSRMTFNSTGTKFNVYPSIFPSIFTISEIDSLTFTDEKPIPPVVKRTYSNPVVTRSLPDPTVIKGEDGYFYLYATEDTYNMPILRSRNLVNWGFLGTVFTNQTRPNFEPGGGLWAPDICRIDGKYVIYYSMSVWGGAVDLWNRHGRCGPASRAVQRCQNAI